MQLLSHLNLARRTVPKEVLPFSVFLNFRLLPDFYNDRYLQVSTQSDKTDDIIFLYLTE